MKADTETIRILHLEDNQIDAKIVTKTLEKANLAFEVLLIDSREEFTQSLGAFEPHIVLCDHGLPTFNSLEALDIMHQAGKNIPFILVTGLVSEEFLGQMCSIPIKTDKPFELKEKLYNDYKIEIPVMQRENESYLRISYQAYNSPDDLEYLKQTIKKLAGYFK